MRAISWRRSGDCALLECTLLTTGLAPSRSFGPGPLARGLLHHHVALGQYLTRGVCCRLYIEQEIFVPENQSPPLGEGHALAAIRAKARNYRRAGTDVGEILQASQRLAHAQVRRPSAAPSGPSHSFTKHAKPGKVLQSRCNPACRLWSVPALVSTGLVCNREAKQINKRAQGLPDLVSSKVLEGR